MEKKVKIFFVFIIVILITLSLIYLNYFISNSRDLRYLPPTKSDVITYFSNHLNISEEDIIIINIQHCIINEGMEETDYYVIHLITQNSTALIYYYDLNTGEYIEHLEYTSKYIEVFQLFIQENQNKNICIRFNNSTTEIIGIPTSLNKIEYNDTNYRYISNILEYDSEEFIHFDLEYFESGINNGSFYYLEATGEQDQFGTRFDFYIHSFIIDFFDQEVYYLDTMSID